MQIKVIARLRSAGPSLYLSIGGLRTTGQPLQCSSQSDCCAIQIYMPEVLKILLVDDNENDRALAARELSRCLEKRLA